MPAKAGRRAAAAAATLAAAAARTRSLWGPGRASASARPCRRPGTHAIAGPRAADLPSPLRVFAPVARTGRRRRATAGRATTWPAVTPQSFGCAGQRAYWSSPGSPCASKNYVTFEAHSAQAHSDQSAFCFETALRLFPELCQSSVKSYHTDGSNAKF